LFQATKTLDSHPCLIVIRYSEPMDSAVGGLVNECAGVCGEVPFVFGQIWIASIPEKVDTAAVGLTLVHSPVK